MVINSFTARIMLITNKIPRRINSINAITGAITCIISMYSGTTIAETKRNAPEPGIPNMHSKHAI